MSTIAMRTFRFVTLVLVALGLTPGAAHVMELGPKMAYDAELYARVTSTLYRYYGIVGGAVQVGSLVAVAVLCWFVRSRSGFRWTLLALAALTVSLALWAALVAPVNAEWGRVLRADPSSAPAAYARLRPRWEYGHAAAFAGWLVGFACLVLSILREIPRDHGTRATGG